MPYPGMPSGMRELDSRYSPPTPVGGATLPSAAAGDRSGESYAHLLSNERPSEPGLANSVRTRRSPGRSTINDCIASSLDSRKAVFRIGLSLYRQPRTVGPGSRRAANCAATTIIADGMAQSQK